MFTGEFSTPAAEAGLAGVRINHTREEHAALWCAQQGAVAGRELHLGTVGKGSLCSSPTALSFLSPLHQTHCAGSDWRRVRPLTHKPQSTSAVSDRDDPW